MTTEPKPVPPMPEEPTITITGYETRDGVRVDRHGWASEPLTD